jgi:hypothetical protein
VLLHFTSPRREILRHEGRTLSPLLDLSGGPQYLFLPSKIQKIYGNPQPIDALPKSVKGPQPGGEFQSACRTYVAMPLGRWRFLSIM